MLALQRQGRIGFYGPSLGQEAAIVGAAIAMEPDDWIVPQYREPGAALVRGMPLKELLCQLIGNAEDPVKGRQMPCHYVYRKGNYLSISAPVGTQTAASTLAQKAPAYGFDGVRVDGMDALAVYRATRDAAARAREGHGPTMIEAVTYRLGPHSSSDDPARYRDEAEVATWRARDPIARFRRYLEHAGWWDEGREARLEQEIGDEITHAIQEAERAGPPGIDTLFTDVYETMPGHLQEERDAFVAFRGR